MEIITKLSHNIIINLTKKYELYLKNECIDIIQLKDICNLFKIKNKVEENVSLNEIDCGSPNFKSVSPKNGTNKKTYKSTEEILFSEEFRKKYDFFIKIVYVCMRMDVEIFNITDEIATFKNNYQLLKSLECYKKQLIEEHFKLLKKQYKNISQKIDTDYESYFSSYITKIKKTDQITSLINKLIVSNTLEKTDSLLTLILPYFYSYTEYIEEYN